MKLDRLIVSSTNDHFLDFLPTVGHAWRKLFPDINISVALIDEGLSEPMKQRVSQIADACLFPFFYNIPKPNLAKVIRFILASMCENEMCIVEDVDTIPLEKSHILNYLSQYESGKLLMVGKEVYLDPKYDPIEHGKCPISYMSGTGNEFKRLFNPTNLEYKELMESFCSLPKYKGEKEYILNPPEFFSDESLIRALIHYNQAEACIKKIDRNMDVNTQCIDRANFESVQIDLNKLNNDEYLTWNFCRPLVNRPFKNNVDKTLFCLSHVYGRKIQLEEVLF